MTRDWARVTPGENHTGIICEGISGEKLEKYGDTIHSRYITTPALNRSKMEHYWLQSNKTKYFRLRLFINKTKYFTYCDCMTPNARVLSAKRLLGDNLKTKKLKLVITEHTTLAVCLLRWDDGVTWDWDLTQLRCHEASGRPHRLPGS